MELHVWNVERTRDGSLIECNICDGTMHYLFCVEARKKEIVPKKPDLNYYDKHGHEKYQAKVDDYNIQSRRFRKHDNYYLRKEGLCNVNECQAEVEIWDEAVIESFGQKFHEKFGDKVVVPDGVVVLRFGGEGYIADTYDSGEQISPLLFQDPACQQLREGEYVIITENFTHLFRHSYVLKNVGGRINRVDFGRSRSKKTIARLAQFEDQARAKQGGSYQSELSIVRDTLQRLYLIPVSERTELWQLAVSDATDAEAAILTLPPIERQMRADDIANVERDRIAHIMDQITVRQQANELANDELIEIEQSAEWLHRTDVPIAKLDSPDIETE